MEGRGEGGAATATVREETTLLVNQTVDYNLPWSRQEAETKIPVPPPLPPSFFFSFFFCHEQTLDLFPTTKSAYIWIQPQANAGLPCIKTNGKWCVLYNDLWILKKKKKMKFTKKKAFAFRMGHIQIKLKWWKATHTNHSVNNHLTSFLTSKEFG